jgi:beta-glucanase (GH16 family)
MLLLLAALGCTSPYPTSGDWAVTWEDEFEGPAGTAPDPARWVHDVGGDGWGNSQLEYDTDRTDNAALDGEGHLVITALRESWEGNEYTSARLTTDGLFDQAYGRFEGRIQLPAGQGLWPAFWMLGSEFTDIGWPWCGEVDILEARGEDPGTAYGTVHGPGYSGSGGISGAYTLEEGTFADDFHDFAVEIDPGQIAWYVDDELYQRITAADLPQDATWVFDDPFFVLLNLAVGGHYVLPPDESTPSPATMLVDRVRVSERAW